jgi:FAD/FMN-containing dehydrogenase
MAEIRDDRLRVPGVGPSQLPASRLRAEERSRAAPRPRSDAARALAADLARAIEGEVRFDDGARALYATDASNYRQVPIGVVVPRSVEDVIAAVGVCRRHGAPVLARGGGTSLAGQCCNVAVVIDFSKHVNRLLALDPASRTAWVEPGLVLDDLRAAAERHGLTFGPDPATHDHCTLGGMIGNDSCGVHSVMAGMTSDNVLALDVLTYDGTRLVVGRGEDPLDALVRMEGRHGEIFRGLRALRDRYADEVRRRFPRIERLVSGFALTRLLPDQGFNVARALVGTEGTCVLVLRAQLRLVPSPSGRALLVLGFPDVNAAADAVPELRRFGPIGLEGFDDRLVEDVRKKRLHPERLKLLPEGRGWLLVEFGGATRGEAVANARRVVDAFGGTPGRPEAKIFDDAAQERLIWKVRESALGATARVPGERDTWEGWEDSAVPVDRLGRYLREFRALLDSHGYACPLYGHFGQGCVHTRIDFDLATPAGIARYRRFAEEAADLVVSHGGSLSGEHGDGQSRGELLRRMYGPELVGAFGEFKRIWDPAGRLNPGKVVDPFPLDVNLRLGSGYVESKPRTHFALLADDGRLGRAVARCIGVGDCRRAEGGVMCPSWRATREEMHTTRGRAHLLFEMLHGDPLRGGWRDPHVKEALDLCLSCKGCKSDCPVNVDVATYRAEFLSHYYARRLRPRAAYAMGLVMYWARLASLAPRAANALAAAPGISRVVKALGGIAPERGIPRFAPYTFRRWFDARRAPRAEAAARGRIILFPDTFTNFFHPRIGIAAVNVLERAA